MIRERLFLPKIEIKGTSVYVRGIGPNLMAIIGSIEMKLLEVDATFYIVPNKLNFSGNGILGTEYLTAARSIIDYDKQLLGLAERILPLVFVLPSILTVMNSMIIN